jgi:SnoaL-like domain
MSSNSLITTEFARSFAVEWIAAWNAHNLPRILSHYSDDFEMRSPLIVERMGIANGALRGKEAVGKYWAIGLAAQPRLCFELIDVYGGIGMIVIHYLSVTRQRRVVEILHFDASGLVVSAAAAYADRI